MALPSRLIFCFSGILLSVLAEKQLMGECNSTYTSPADLLWLTSSASECSEDYPCVHRILAPDGLLVRLNFTQLSGLEYSELSSALSSYELIEGRSNCQPRIEVVETYTQSHDVEITRRQTLCYDRVQGSSVIILTKSQKVNLYIYCLARKFSFFAVNISFVTKPGDCLFECYGVCIGANRLCDGHADCPDNKDENGCANHSGDLRSVDFSHDKFSESGISPSMLFIAVATLTCSVLLIVITLLACHRSSRLNCSVKNTTQCSTVPASSFDISHETRSTANNNPNIISEVQPEAQHLAAGNMCSECILRKPVCSSQHQEPPNVHTAHCPSHVINSYDGERGFAYQETEIRNANLWEVHSQQKYDFDSVAPPNKYPFKTNSRHCSTTSHTAYPPPPYYQQAGPPSSLPPPYEAASHVRQTNHS